MCVTLHNCIKRVAYKYQHPHRQNFNPKVHEGSPSQTPAYCKFHNAPSKSSRNPSHGRNMHPSNSAKKNHRSNETSKQPISAAAQPNHSRIKLTPNRKHRVRECSKFRQHQLVSISQAQQPCRNISSLISATLKCETAADRCRFGSNGSQIAGSQAREPPTWTNGPGFCA